MAGRTANIRPKRITSKQKAARRKNIAIARQYKNKQRKAGQYFGSGKKITSKERKTLQNKAEKELNRLTRKGVKIGKHFKGASKKYTRLMTLAGSERW